MPSKPTPKALAITGETAMTAMHAVVDMATCTSRGVARGELRGRLAEFVRETDLLPDTDGRPVYRALTVTLARLLHRSVERLVAYMPVSFDTSGDMLRHRLRREDESIQDLAVAALCPNVADFVAAIGYGTETPADPVEVGIAAAAVLRVLLDVQADGDDPLRQWAVLARVTNAVMAKHYLH